MLSAACPFSSYACQYHGTPLFQTTACNTVNIVSLFEMWFHHHIVIHDDDYDSGKNSCTEPQLRARFMVAGELQYFGLKSPDQMRFARGMARSYNRDVLKSWGVEGNKQDCPHSWSRSRSDCRWVTVSPAAEINVDRFCRCRKAHYCIISLICKCSFTRESIKST